MQKCKSPFFFLSKIRLSCIIIHPKHLGIVDEGLCNGQSRSAVLATVQCESHNKKFAIVTPRTRCELLGPSARMRVVPSVDDLWDPPWGSPSLWVTVTSHICLVLYFTVVSYEPLRLERRLQVFFFFFFFWEYIFPKFRIFTNLVIVE